jgi:hypothetical protein
MPSIRERASDTLLRVGTANSLDRADLTRSLHTVPSNAPGYHAAAGAMAFARWFDTAVLWASWRLRPRRITDSL